MVYNSQFNEYDDGRLLSQLFLGICSGIEIPRVALPGDCDRVGLNITIGALIFTGDRLWLGNPKVFDLVPTAFDPLTGFNGNYHFNADDSPGLVTQPILVQSSPGLVVVWGVACSCSRCPIDGGGPVSGKPGQMYDYKTRRFTSIGDSSTRETIVNADRRRVGLIISTATSVPSGIQIDLFITESLPLLRLVNPFTEKMPYRDYGPIIQEKIVMITTNPIVINIVEILAI